MDAVSTVMPGVATGAAPPVDSDAQAPAVGFPAALGQALAQPAVAADGNSPPPAGGQMLPVLPAVTVAAAEPITPAAAPAAADGLPLPADAQPPGAVAAVVDALGDIARGQKAAPAAAQSGVSQPSPAVSSDPVAIPVAAGGALQATDAGEGQGADAEAATVIAAQVLESAPGAARRATRRAVTADPPDPAAAQLPPGLQLHRRVYRRHGRQRAGRRAGRRPRPAGSRCRAGGRAAGGVRDDTGRCCRAGGCQRGAGPRPGK